MKPRPPTPSHRSPDYALLSGGGRIWKEATSASCAIRKGATSYSLFSLLSGSPRILYSDPEWALHPQTNLGMCWGHAGTKGHLGIFLMSTIAVSAVTLEHPLEVRVNPSSTPRDLVLLGIVEDQEQIQRLNRYYSRRSNGSTIDDLLTLRSSVVSSMDFSLREDTVAVLSAFTYDLHQSNDIQTFSVFPDMQELSLSINRIILVTMNNWGNNDHTLLCRVRVHGNRSDVAGE
ncbi:hypothetical protein SISNIDRAFT_408876 [Sistotremastrum niveocremeum HHB9708]|uniref:SUN domain-containing protein n=1 Tax=Sistotremastrum niveocremeum HHB9708 TaxID=1314777 RepID=A0A164WGM1_9AGAM|nr:hypothetical protein SISNIDRAFT_408876 [Sistotremastrum niveocremeum HHB9708]